MYIDRQYSIKYRKSLRGFRDFVIIHTLLCLIVGSLFDATGVFNYTSGLPQINMFILHLNSLEIFNYMYNI